MEKVANQFQVLFQIWTTSSQLDKQSVFENNNKRIGA